MLILPLSDRSCTPQVHKQPSSPKVVLKEPPSSGRWNGPLKITIKGPARPQAALMGTISEHMKNIPPFREFDNCKMDCRLHQIVANGPNIKHSLIISREVLILTLSIFNALKVCIS